MKPDSVPNGQFELKSLKEQLSKLQREINKQKRAEKVLEDKQRLNELLMNSLPHFAMVIRKDRIILTANRLAQDFGAKVGGYCWRDFGRSDFIPEQDKKYINDHKKLPPGGTCCYFCLADEALKKQKPTNNPELKAWGKIWDTHWIPLDKETYFHYAIDTTEHKRMEEALKHVKKELTIRNKIAEIFLTIPDEQMFGEVLRVILDALESKFGIFGYIDERGVLIIPSMTKEIWEKCQIPDKTVVYPPEKWGGIWGRALVEKKSLFANEGLHVPEGHIHITRVLVVPVIYAGQVIGLLEVANKSTDYSHKDQDFLETIAWKIAPILNARLQRDREERERKQTEEALRQARNELEQRVKDRTSELDKANEQLRQKIEELKQKEKALRRSENELQKKGRSLAEAQRIIHLGSWDLNIISNKLLWSDETYRIFGFQPQEFGATYETFLESVHPNDRESVKQAVNESLANPDVDYSIEHRVVRPDGSECIVHEQGEVTFDKNGKAVHMIGTVHDITDRKRAEEEAHRLREEYVHIARVAAMGELTASLAHELKQPLAAIRSNAQAAQRFLASEKPDLDELREILTDIIKDNRRADEVIGRLRLLMQKSDLQITELNINDVIHEIFPLIHSYEIMRNISLEFELDDRILSVAGDRVQLLQVLLNLVLNGSEALMNIDVDYREIIVRTTQEEPQNVTVAIIDSGTGIDEENLEHLFEPFFTTKREGLGMGLAISRSIIEAHEGRIWATNNPDRGATFYFTVPVFKGSSA